jgi:hypothetical protein
MMNKVSQFVDLFPDFHDLDPNEQIIRLIYFHTIEEKRETVSQDQLAIYFNFAEISTPKTLQQKLGYLCGRGKKLRCSKGEYSLERRVRMEVQEEVNRLRGIIEPPKLVLDAKFEFPGKVFKDIKIQRLLQELGKCFSVECWNACGILIRIIVERALDASAPEVKAKSGLKDKINFASSASGLPISKSTQDSLKVLHGAKLVGDIVAHHSSTLLDKGDIEGVLPHFRMLLKEIKTI